MIKVIERGTKTIGECENCGCRFSYDEKDIKKIQALWYGKIAGSYILYHMSTVW